MKLTACGKTDVGLLRSNNEDSCYTDAETGLFIVADGMGGHAAGEVASEMAVNVVRDQLIAYLQKTAPPDDIGAVLAKSVHQANRIIEQAAEENSAWQGMGTTLTVLLLQEQQALLTHVGDSRLYRFQDNHLEQLSDDHSLVGEQLRSGLISHDEADSSDLRNILLQAVGITPELELCRKQFPLHQGDQFLLCSDGLTTMLSDATIETSCRNTTDQDQLCDELIQQANAAGGKDNIAVVLVRVEEI